MHCYCYKEVIANVNRDALNKEFSSVKAGDDTKYCTEWFEHYVIHQSISYGLSLVPVVINGLVTFLF